MGYVMYALPDIKRIYVYVNGDEYQSASNIIVHPRRIRNYEIFLRDLTEKLRPPFGAVRNVYTPVNGSRIRNLDDLENHQNYVAAGKEGFKKFDYIDIEEMQAKKNTPKVPAGKGTQNTQQPKRHFKRRPYTWEPISIYLYRNGDDISPAKKLALIRSELENWDNFLLKVGEKLDQQGFIRRLYNLNGEWIRDATGIVNNQQYVGVSGYEQFNRVMYGKLITKLPKQFLNDGVKEKRVKPTSPTLSTKKTTSTVKLPKFLKRPKLGIKDEAIKTTRPALPPVKKLSKNIDNRKHETESKLKDRKTTLQKTNEKLKKDGKSPDSEDSAYMSETEGRRKKFGKSLNQRNDGVYFAQTRKFKPKKVAMVDYDEDSGGIYRAKSRHSELNHAKEVKELRNLPVELPIDEVEAVEVGSEVLSRHEEVDEEEEEETEDDVKESSDDDIKHHHHQSSSEKEVTSLDSNVLDSPDRKLKPPDENSYPIAYNRELPTSARTA
ncbi:hypothetical protein CHUAL_002374 [Chamberlinius hualienensis]